MFFNNKEKDAKVISNVAFLRVPEEYQRKLFRKLVFKILAVSFVTTLAVSVGIS